jgi:copper transport protein
MNGSPGRGRVVPIRETRWKKLLSLGDCFGMNRGRIRRRWLVALVIGLLTAILGPAAGASAHAELLASEPAAGAILASTPTSITLRFSEAVEISLGAIRLVDGVGTQVQIGPTTHPGGDRSVVSAVLPPLGDGSYVVDWRVISADSHQVHAAYTFQVGQHATLQPGVVATAIASGGTGRAAGVALAVSRALVAASFAVVVGSLVVLSGGLVGLTRRLRRTVQVAAAVGALGGLSAIPAEAAYATNRSLAVVTDPSAWRAVLQTDIGRDWLLRAVLLGVGSAVLVALIESNKSRQFRALGVGLATVTALTFAFGGHGNTGRWHAVGVVATVVHVLAMAVWLGGLVALWQAIGDVDTRSVRRFSWLAFCCVAGVVLSGSLQSVRQLASLSNLTSTRYGQLLILKLGAVALTLFVAALSRKTVHGGVLRGRSTETVLAGNEPVELDRETLRRSVSSELIFGALALAITSVLMAANPSAAGSAKPFAVSLIQDNYVASISIEPARVGPNQMHVYLSSVTGSLDNPDNVTIQLSDPSRDVAPIELVVQPAGAAHYVAVGQVPYAATWTLSINARYHTFDQVIFTTTVRINR